MKMDLSDLDRINYLNIWLMVGSAAAAYLFPFELFLAAYAILGPLHYLTEISWLHDRKYFTHGRFDLPLLITFAVLGSYPWIIAIPRWYLTYEPTLIAFIAAFAMAFVRDPKRRWLCIALAVPLVALLSNLDGLTYLSALFLPTLIHVFIFTWLFVLYGALRSKSASGIASLLVFSILAASFFVVPAPPAVSLLSAYVHASIAEFGNLHGELARLIGWDAQSTRIVCAMRFIAFAYTYHYLNWFSKTQIIRWHRIPRTRFAALTLAYLLSVLLYAYDYRVGLAALALLSFGHVVLEFPLNARTIHGIAHELRTLKSNV